MKEILLTKGLITLVDDDDYEKINQFKWHANSDGTNDYARRKITVNGKRIVIAMHRFILNIIDPNVQIDHIDGKTLNNQKKNLRACESLSNNKNKHKRTSKTTSAYKGIHWNKDNNKWRAKIYVNKKTIHLGYFEIDTDAAKAYNEAALHYFGEFASLNNC